MGDQKTHFLGTRLNYRTLKDATNLLALKESLFVTVGYIQRKSQDPRVFHAMNESIKFSFARPLCTQRLDVKIKYH